MWLSRSLLSLLILHSLSSLAKSWDNADPYYSYTEQQEENSDYSYRQSERPPPRISSEYEDSRPVYTNPYSPPYQSEIQDDTEEREHGNMGPSCSKRVFLSVNKIIDIQLSVQYGAQLLDGIFAQDFDGCVAACCHYAGCDLALYKTDGVSQTGKTCYFVHCGLPEHCRMVDNPGFKAGFLVNNPNYGDLLDQQTPASFPFETAATTTSEVTTPTAPPTTEMTTPTAPLTTEVTTPTAPPATEVTTPTAPPATEVTTPTAPPATEVTTPTAPPTTEYVTTAPLSTDATPSTETTPTQTIDQTTPPAMSDSETAKNPSSTSATNSPKGSELSAATQPSSSEKTTDETTPTDSTHQTGPEEPEKPASAKSGTGSDDITLATEEDYQDDECGKKGCDGGGLIAVTIVGTLIIVVLLVVAAAVTRRLYKMKTRRQYRNVDYLINGMYT